jgi:hypothetical protein
MIAGAAENVHRGGSGSPKEIGEVASNLWIFSKEKDVGISGTARGKTERVKAWRRRGCPAFGERHQPQDLCYRFGAHACKSVQSNCNQYFLIAVFKILDCNSIGLYLGQGDLRIFVLQISQQTNAADGNRAHFLGIDQYS